MSPGGLWPNLPQPLPYVTAVSLAAGLFLFLIPPFGAMPLAYQALLAGLALVAFAYSDGRFGRLRIALAFLEGLLLLKLALGWTGLLVEAWRDWGGAT